MEQLGLRREDEYLERLRGDAATTRVETELHALLNLVTITETCFFRDASQFTLLGQHIVPTLMGERLAAGNPSRTIRIWSAGCSTGEEAYSVAMAIDEMGFFGASCDWRVEIIATDVNTKVLQAARRGVYSARAVRNVEGRLLERYFSRREDAFVLSDDIKKRVLFEFGNLTQMPMPSTGPQDIVFCKNVAIYFRPDVTRTLMRGLYETLTPRGYLLLGHAESLWHVSDEFSIVEHERAFCYRKAGAVTSMRPVPVVPGHLRTAPPPASRIVGEGGTPAVDYDACLSAFRAGDWDVAEAGLLALTRSSPTFVPAQLLLGGLYANRGRFEDATEQAQTVLCLNDLEPRAHLLAGMIAARRQKTDEALHSLRQALYLDDSLALAHFWLGNLYRDRGDLARACHEYETVVRDWENRRLQFTEEFAQDLTADQIVDYCRGHLPVAK
jgi:chemotaxis protein methyltransferase CheR